VKSKFKWHIFMDGGAYRKRRKTETLFLYRSLTGSGHRLSNRVIFDYLGDLQVPFLYSCAAVQQMTRTDCALHGTSLSELILHL